MCDNGKMIGLKPQELVVPLTELQLSPPYRPDFKAMVERRFGLLNKELIHKLQGTTRGGKVIRGDRDPRKDAIYTLREFTALLIDAVLELNRTPYDDLATTSPIVIKRDLSPTPINFWKAHLLEHKHSLKSANTSEIISHLYPSTQVSMTRDGIEYKRMYYSCNRLLERDLASIARTEGRWSLDARINENTTNYIYVKFDKNEGFTKCHLLPKSKVLKDLPMQEAELMQDWLDSKKEASPISVESLGSKSRRKSSERKAKLRAKKDPLSFSEKTKNTRQHRESELNTIENPMDQYFDVLSKESNDITGQKSNEVLYLPRRKNKKGAD